MRTAWVVVALLMGGAGCSVESDGAGGGAAEEGGGGEGGGACVSDPEPCGQDIDCCEGSLCVVVADEVACRPTCVEHADCATGCCANLIGGGDACLPAEYCVVPP